MLYKVSEYMNSFVASLNDETVLSLWHKVPHGKMLRAKLILQIAPEASDALKLAAIIEMIHAASLLHDDVIDESDTRRGAASFNAAHGDKQAIMLGDILYSTAFSYLSEFPAVTAKTVSSAVAFLSVGEMMDVELSKTFNEEKDKYFKMIYAKTASLIEASASAAAMFDKLKSIESFALYGRNLGLAFQIIDDVLDVTANSSTLGKPAMSDFIEGKVTLPYLYAYEKCSQNEKKHFKTLRAKRLNSYEIGWIKDKMESAKAIDKCVKEAKKLGSEAIKAIKKYKIKGLENVVEQMIERDF